MKLSDYQIEAAGRLLAATKPTPTFGLFDVPGAGKTATAIAAWKQLDRYPVVITVPAHLALQWRSQLISWGIPAEEIECTPRGMSLERRLRALENSEASFQIVTYHMWSNTNYWPYLLQRRQQAYGFDEAHRLRKGRHGKKGWWETVNWLRTKTKSTHRYTPLWLFSGTPIVKDATDVWPLLHLANPDRYTKRDDFATEYCVTNRTPYKLEVGKLRDPARFRKLMGRYSIRRSYKDIPELQHLQRRDILVPVELTKSELLRHRILKRDWRDPVTKTPLDNPSSLIHALRRLTIQPKIDAWTELYADHPGRWLILCWYRDSVSLAYDAAVKLLGRDKVGVITGGASELSREIAMAAYRDGGVLIGTIAALGEGLNLQQGYQVAFLEESWLSVDNDQAVGRVLRRGQDQPVLVFQLRSPKTFDMRVARTAEKRGADIDRALDEFIDDAEWEN